jgi:hypothetical protein
MSALVRSPYFLSVDRSRSLLKLADPDWLIVQAVV